MIFKKIIHHVVILISLLFDCKSETKPKPIILIPGIGGCQLEAKLSKAFKDDTNCRHNDDDWFRIWADITIFAGQTQQSICLKKYMSLVYNWTTMKSTGAPGIETRVPGWGSTITLEYIDPSWTAWIFGNLGTYFSSLVSQLVSKLGYKRGHDLRGAPYDWRKGPHSQPEYFLKLKQLVEETFLANGRTKIVLLAHSLGGIFALYFLQLMPRTWKDEYIHNFVPVNSPWGGTILSVLCYASGYSWGIPTIDPLEMRKMQRSYESNAYVYPNQNTYNSNTVIIQTLFKNYTIHNLSEFFIDINFNLANEFAYNVLPVLPTLSHPEVVVHCFYSSGIPAPMRLIYRNEYPDHQPNIVYNDGDGTLLSDSMKACKIWKDEKSHPDYNFHLHHIPNVNHHDVLNSEMFLEILKSIVTV